MATRSSRRATRAIAPSVTGEDRVRSVVQKFRAIAEDHLASGGTAEEWSAALMRLDEPTDGDRGPTTRHMATLETFASLLETWHSDAIWMEAGQPRALAPGGVKGFAGLCRAVGVGTSARSLASLGLAVGILAKGALGALKPADRSALVGRPSPMLLEMMSVGITAWQSTARHNVKKETRKSARRFDRGVYRQAIPAASEPAFHRAAGRAGKQFIDCMDNWIQAHRAGPAESDIRLVSAHAFAATEEKPAARLERRGPP